MTGGPGTGESGVRHSAARYANPRPPVALFRRSGPDRLMRALQGLAATVEPITARLPQGNGTPEPTDDLRVRVLRVERPVADVAALTLVPDRPGDRLPSWQPGHHVDVVLAGGVVRQYSLNGDPRDRGRYRIAVRRIPGGTGSALVHGLAEGDTLGLRGPRNAFPFTRAERYLFVAGGIGITPVLPMVWAAHRAGAPFRLVYTGRSRSGMPFLDELPEGADAAVRPDDEYGPPEPARILDGLAEGTAVYACGPAPLIDAVRGHVPPGTPFFSERFAPVPITAGAAFEVRLGRDGPVVPVAADESALDAVRRVRPRTAYSCRQGFCGTCRVGVLEGEPEHRDRPTGGSARGAEFALCVSRAGEGKRIVIDV